MLVNIVSGQDNLAAYGDSEGDQADRYARTKEFLQLVRRLWTEENVTFHGEHFARRRTPPCPATGRPRRPAGTRGSTSAAPPRPPSGSPPPRPTCSSSGASRSTASRERIERLQELEREPGARARRRWSSGCGSPRWSGTPPRRPGPTPRPRSRRWRAGSGDIVRTQIQRSGQAVGQQRLLDLAAARRGARRHPLHRARASSAAAAPAPPGWSARPRTWRRAAQVPGARHHPLRALRHPVPARRSPGSATNCCRCCGRTSWSRGPPDAQAQRASASRSPLLSPPSVGGGRRRSGGAGGRPGRRPRRRSAGRSDRPRSPRRGTSWSAARRRGSASRARWPRAPTAAGWGPARTPRTGTVTKTMSSRSVRRNSQPSFESLASDASPGST